MNRLSTLLRAMFCLGLADADTKARVWYVQATSKDGSLAEGSAVAVRLSDGSTNEGVLLTCRHVVCDSDGKFRQLRCWPHGSGYNPDCPHESKKWIATPWAGLTMKNGDFIQEAAQDWVLLHIDKDGERLVDMPYAPVSASALRGRLRLVGFLGGDNTMYRDVVRASVSRDFRSAETDSAAGTIGLTGPEGAGAGFSGAPYLDRNGELLAIHRGVMTLDDEGRSRRPIALTINLLRDRLKPTNWTLVGQQAMSKRTWAARAIALILVFLSAALAYEACTPQPLYVDCIAGLSAHQTLCSSDFELVGGGIGQAAIVGDRLTYTAAGFDEYEEATKYTAEYKLGYRRRFFWIPLPSGEIVLRIRKRLTFKTYDEVHAELSQEPNRELLLRKSTKPVLSITPLGAGEGLSVYQDATEVVFEWSKPEMPTIELRLFVGNHSPVQGYFDYGDEAMVCLRDAYVRAGEEYLPNYNAPDPSGSGSPLWVVRLEPAVTAHETTVPAN